MHIMSTECVRETIEAYVYGRYSRSLLILKIVLRTRHPLLVDLKNKQRLRIPPYIEYFGRQVIPCDGIEIIIEMRLVAHGMGK